MTTTSKFGSPFQTISQCKTPTGRITPKFTPSWSIFDSAIQLSNRKASSVRNLQIYFES